MTDGSGRPAAEQMLFARWREQVVAALGDAREEIDALNVYPVPDADTGTNVYLTFEAAAQAARDAEVDGADLVGSGKAFIDGALRGARGNSGVIMSQLLRAGVPMLLGAGVKPEVASGAGRLLAVALDAAATAAYTAVGRPVEGTILTVARAAADGAAGAVDGGDPSLRRALRTAVTAARESLERTPEQLEPLRRAGVVDAGGRALVVVLDTTERVLIGRVDPQPRSSRRALPVPTRPGDVAESAGPAYEVMYLLDAADQAVPGLRAELSALGDALVVVGGDGLWNVHVHVDDAGAAIEAGILAGRPHRVVVTHLSDRCDRYRVDQGRIGQSHDAHGAPTGLGRVVVIGAVGPGLAALFAEAGAVAVDTVDGRRPNTHQLLDAMVRCGAAEVVALPNDRDVVAAAEAAARQARDRGIRVAVIPTRAQVQGLAALAVHDPGRGFDDDVVHMSAAAGQTRDGAVTVATRRAITSAGPCQPGDVLGVVDGDFALVGAELGEVAVAVVDRLLGGAGELLTIVSGSEVPAGLVGHVEGHVRRHRPEVDVVVHDGGQAGYPLLLAVE